VRSTLTLQPYVPRRSSLVAQAFRVLASDEVLSLDVDWKHSLPPFEVKYFDLELLDTVAIQVS
jgi:hypothetical protein